MKRLLLFVIPALILAAIIILSYQFFFLKKNEKGALQITSSPQSSVYLDGKLLGKTPLCKCEASDMLSVGSYTLRIVPTDSSFPEYQEKIDIASSVLTVVDRKFGKGASSEGSVIFLTPLQDRNDIQLLVLSLPDASEIMMDNAGVGQTPLLLSEATESDHALRVKKTGYKDKVVRIRTPKGYKLTARVYLGIDEVLSVSTSSPSATPSGPAPTGATPTGSRTTPTPTGKKTPTPTPKKSGKVVILETPNGFLRVRASASINSAEIDRVSPGDTLDYISEQSGWYQVELSDGTRGWVSSQFAEKQ